MLIYPPPAERAFSLVELSIVLVILGLMVGGVLSGRSLIRASEMRAIVSEFQRYQTAIQTFKGKYFALPGDMTNATAFWGYTGGAGCTNRSGTAAASPGTCDGDGDGILVHAAAGNQSGEAFQGWRHLALAGLIDGSYTGIAGATSYAWYASYGGAGIQYSFGTNSPKSKIGKLGWALAYFNNSTTLTPAVFSYNYLLGWMMIGGNQVDLTFADDEFLTPSEAWGIDVKLDDGLPDKGRVHTRPSCASSGQYLLSSSAVLCSLLFKY